MDGPSSCDQSDFNQNQTGIKFKIKKDICIPAESGSTDISVWTTSLKQPVLSTQIGSINTHREAKRRPHTHKDLTKVDSGAATQIRDCFGIKRVVGKRRRHGALRLKRFRAFGPPPPPHRRRAQRTNTSISTSPFILQNERRTDGPTGEQKLPPKKRDLTRNLDGVAF